MDNPFVVVDMAVEQSTSKPTYVFARWMSARMSLANGVATHAALGELGTPLDGTLTERRYYSIEAPLYRPPMSKSVLVWSRTV